MDAANIDLKAFTEGFYRALCSAELGPVLDTLEYRQARDQRLAGDHDAVDPRLQRQLFRDRRALANGS